MLISEPELERLHKRFPYPRFSLGEYERRYNSIRNMMREKQLDCLLIIGGSAAYGRLWFNIRYVTNMMGKAEMANYCLFPKEGDPCVIVRPGHSLASGMLARTVVKEIILGEPDILTAIVRTIQERGYDKGRIGIVEYDPFTSIPKNHWDFFVSRLPRAEFVFVTKEFAALRLIKSDEEIQALEKSAEFGDIGLQALAEKLRPGMTEGEAFAIVHEAVLKAGGEMGMIQLASARSVGVRSWILYVFNHPHPSRLLNCANPQMSYPHLNPPAIGVRLERLHEARKTARFPGTVCCNLGRAYGSGDIISGHQGVSARSLSAVQACAMRASRSAFRGSSRSAVSSRSNRVPLF